MNTSVEKYKALVDVFKGYLDTALTGNIWFYAFTGTVVTYFLSNREGKPYLRYSLFIPFCLALFVIALSLRGKRRARSLERKMLHGDDKLEHDPEPPLEFLFDFLKISIFLVVVVIVVLGILFWWPPSLFGP